MKNLRLLLAVFVCTLAGCSVLPPQTPSSSHLLAKQQPAVVAEATPHSKPPSPAAEESRQMMPIAAISPQSTHDSAVGTSTKGGQNSQRMNQHSRALDLRPKPETFSVQVDNVPARELLFALARDAKMNADVHPGIVGTVSLNAIDQTLPQLLTRIGRQVDMRWQMVDGADVADGGAPTLLIEPDTPFLRAYKVDYVNMSRDAVGTLSVTTQVASGAPGTNASNTSGNNSFARIENTAKNHFWDNLIQNIKDILRETDKLLPEGSSEETEEIQGDVSSVNTGTQVTRKQKPSSASSGAGRKSGESTVAGPNASEVQNRGTRVLKRSTFREAASVIVHPETGVLTVRATSRQHEKIRDYLDQVTSAARRQVLIEATVAEVRLDNGYQQGIDWSRILPGGATGFSLSQQSAAGAPLNQAGAGQFRIGYVNANSAIGNISSTIKLLESFGTVKVLSSPKISVLNNQTAVLKVVDNVVWFTIKADITPGNQNSNAVVVFTSTVNSVPVGFVMNVTPQISEGDAVVLNVRPSISRQIGAVADPNPNLAQANVQSLVPVIRTREMESVLRIENGSTAVMGGLMEDARSNQDDTVPGINRVPILGALFANRNDNVSKTELVVFLKPTVIRDASLNGDYRDLRSRLPGPDFFSASPGPPPANRGVEP